MSNTIKNVWLLAEGDEIGGAETRMAKTAARLAEEPGIGKIRLLLTKKLERSYSKHNSLQHILKLPKIEVETTNTSLNFFFRNVEKILKKTGLKITFIRRFILKKTSWVRFLEKHVEKNDIIHCYMGNGARNGAFLLSQRKANRVIIEITNNRYLKKVSNQFKVLSGRSTVHKNLTIQSVSKRVHENWLSYFPDNWFQKRGIQPSFYKGAFIDPVKFTGEPDKENIIVFPHRFVGPKNAVLFSEVIQELLNEGHLDDWQIFFRGTGPQEDIISDNLGKWIEKGRVNVNYTNQLFRELQRAKIVVSLIETGSYPSQSVFEAMQAGCALLLSDSGNTKNEFDHSSITYTPLDKTGIKKNLLSLTKMSHDEIVHKGRSMQEYFKWFNQNRHQFNEVKQLYGIA